MGEKWINKLQSSQHWVSEYLKELICFRSCKSPLSGPHVQCYVWPYISSASSFERPPTPQSYSKSPIHQSALRIAIPQGRYSAVFRAGGEFEGKEISYFYSTKWFMPRLLSGSLPHPCKDHFPWLHLTTGTILSIDSLIQSDWIHCSAILMDVLWSFFSLNSHPNPLFNLWGEFPPKNATPLSSESQINQLLLPFVASVHLNEIALASLHQTIHNDSSSDLNLPRPFYILTTTEDTQLKVLQFVLHFHRVFRYFPSETSKTLTSFLLSGLLFSHSLVRACRGGQKE